ncbi:MAG: STAS domain-containing protein [Bacteroidetes bacterium]|uniref:Anti-sigma factor antagonist n=1 Tax=Candidatus Caccoplasma merdipullorum TaxID=2840718 RepID=A0A9D9H3X0_9BACT|nr:STAS domain-containing protein [Candidatus Caccoplasma merdipullorum]
MKTTITNEQGKTTVTVEGRIDTLTSPEFLKETEPLTTSENPDITIDCKNLQYISSAGLRALLILQKNVKVNNGTLILTNVIPAIKEIFKMTGFEKIFTIK